MHGVEAPIRLLEADPELGLRVPAARIGDARDQLVAQVMALRPGHWEVPHQDGERGGLGFLMLDGLLARDLRLAGKTCTELLGEGDVTQPWVPEQADGLIRYHVSWHVLAPTRMAVLDDGFARALAEWPQVMTTLLERAIRRTLRMAVHEAVLQLSPVETRLHVFFWHLAERWGHVTPDGVRVRLPLSHALLGDLVGSRRASVTTGLRHLSESGLLTRHANDVWLITGSPPDEYMCEAGQRVGSATAGPMPRRREASGVSS